MKPYVQIEFTIAFGDQLDNITVVREVVVFVDEMGDCTIYLHVFCS